MLNDRRQARALRSLRPRRPERQLGGHHFTDVEDIFSAFGDIFGDLFGGGGATAPRKGRDVRCDVTLTLHEAAHGVTKTVEFQRHERCETCEGTGAAEGQPARGLHAIAAGRAA